MLTLVVTNLGHVFQTLVICTLCCWFCTLQFLFATALETFGKERCSTSEELDWHQNEWSQEGIFLRFLRDFYNIQKANWAAVKKSWNLFFIAKMYHSGLPVLRLGAAEAGQQSVCLEYWYTARFLKPWAGETCKCMNKTKSPAPPTSRGNFIICTDF